jgi:hypothetical protein
MFFIEITIKNSDGDILASNGKARYDESVNYDEKVYELAQRAEDEVNRRQKELESNQYDPDYKAEVATNDYGRN